MVFKPDLIADLKLSLAGSHAGGAIQNRFWNLHWRYGVKRIEDKARDNVLSIANVTLDEKIRGRGKFTELVTHLVEHPDFAGRQIDWIYIEQCRFRLGEHLRRELDFTIQDGMVIDAWRRTTSQMELGL